MYANVAHFNPNLLMDVTVGNDSRPYIRAFPPTSSTIMKRVNKVSLCAAAFSLVALHPLQAAPISGDTVTTNLTVQGNTDIEGNITTIGSWTGDTTHFGLQIGYIDSATSAIVFTAGRGANVWQWEQNAFGTPTKQMTLDGTAKLSLFDSSGSAVIVFNPAGASPGITVNGQSVLTTVGGAIPYLTPLAANASYARIDALNLALGYGASSGTDAYAFGKGAQALGNGSIAIGSRGEPFAGAGFDEWATATGVHSLAVGFGTTSSQEYSSSVGTEAAASGWASSAFGFRAASSGMLSSAMGGQSIASGTQSLALGYGATSSGYASTTVGFGHTASSFGSTAMGFASEAGGDFSTAIGFRATAQAFSSIVLGTFNVLQGDRYNWVPTDDLLVVGNGTEPSAPSNALTIKKSGTAAFAGGMSVGPGTNSRGSAQVVLGKYNDDTLDAQGTDHSSGLLIIGMGSGTGTAPRKNALRVRENGTLLIRPAGDLSMGDFQGGEQP